MRILFVVLEDFPGSENRVQRQVRSMASAGHEVRILCVAGASGETEWEGARIHRTRTRRRKAGGLMDRLWEYVAFPIEAAAVGLRIVFAWRPHVVQVSTPPDWLVWSALPARLRGAAIVMDIHDPMPELMQAKGGSERAASILRLLERASVRAADLVLAPTPAVAEVLERRSPSASVMVVPNSVDTEVFPITPPSAAEGARIVYHGTVARRFGIETLLEAVHILGGQGRDFHVDVYGDGDALTKCAAAARELGLDGRVAFHGQQPSASLAEKLRGAHAGVVPYEDSAFMRLAYSTKAFEYAALGIPMVMSDLPSLREQFTDEAVRFFTPGDPMSLAEALAEVLGEPSAAAARADAAQRELAGFLWSSWQDGYVEAIAAEAAR